MDLYFGSVKFFKHLITVVLALVVAASVTLVALFSIENSNLREQLEKLAASENPVPPENPHTADNPAPPDEQTPPPPEPPWPPEASGDYADLFPRLYSVNSPQDRESLIAADAPNHVYLTFDDGPNSSTTTILNFLRTHEITATFFVIPRAANAGTLRRIRDDGHAIGIHSYTHVLPEIYESVEAFLEDFDNARNLVYEQTGILSDFFRFPGGSINDYNGDTRADIIAEMHRRGFVYFDWNVDSQDVRGAGYDRMLADVPREIHARFNEGERSIILFHDAAPHTTWVVGHIIERLLAHDNKYEFRALCANTNPHNW